MCPAGTAVFMTNSMLLWWTLDNVPLPWPQFGGGHGERIPPLFQTVGI